MKIEPVSNLARLAQWNFESASLALIVEHIEEHKNILLTGPVGSGKTSLLKDLISLTDPEHHFGYLYRNGMNTTYNERNIHPWDVHRVAGAINVDFDHAANDELKIGNVKAPDFFIVDDVGVEFDRITEMLTAMSCTGTLATNHVIYRDTFGPSFFRRQKYYDMVIKLEKYHQSGAVYTAKYPQLR
ncbi:MULTISPECIES: ATP-binding protein [Paenibacillus]|uniref:ATP-binding protein n=1 Tax=Paenibacillus TaxID=44249 RepID=UPI0004678FB3|nr:MULTISPECIES: ATP-binding protein [Paenibacillus]KGP77694.1 hypothetical protein P364_0131970 [Paenibacillus sp. MAEPY2]KGP78687.1 hypothetical protein P363_0131950 [Paenibacillus sp. MAEPY1]OZQ62807.1 hypothetical protein CA599_25430 [Paenibacillus taichungensis]